VASSITTSAARARRLSTDGPAAATQAASAKSNFPYPRYNTSRIFWRTGIGLVGERDKIEGEYGQLSGEKTCRGPLQVGTFFR